MSEPKKPPPRPKDPIDSFGPEIFNALVEGSRRLVELKLPYREAVKLRLRIHKLRAQMREEGHPLYGMALKAEVRIDIPQGTTMVTSSRNVRYPADRMTMVKLTIAPRDSDFVTALRDAGISVKPVDLKAADTKPSSDDSLSNVDWLKDLK